MLCHRFGTKSVGQRWVLRDNIRLWFCPFFYGDRRTGKTTFEEGADRRVAKIVNKDDGERSTAFWRE